MRGDIHAIVYNNFKYSITYVRNRQSMDRYKQKTVCIILFILRFKPIPRTRDLLDWILP